MSGTQTSIRKALGALKDQTSVGLVKINSEFKDIDIAVVKATNHIEAPPKEKHVRTIFAATQQSRPRADVAYTMHALAKRLQKTHNWAVALKTLMVIHRTLREGDPTFREELINYARNRGHILNLSNFKDDSSPNAWDYSAWVRTYALFLEERLECFRVLKYDVESERSTGYSKTRELDTPDLLEHLPALQQLLFRLMCCQPEGAAVSNHVVQAALGLVLKESFKLYRAINDGIINLVDKFFEMQRHDAIKALEIYKRAGQQAERLQEFYDVCKNMDLARSFQFPTLEQPPQSFLATMEEYVKDAPRAAPVPRIEDGQYDDDDRGSRDRRSFRGDDRDRDRDRDFRDRENGRGSRSVKSPRTDRGPPPPPRYEENNDLLGLGDNRPDPSALEDANALALAIVPSSGAAPNGTTTAETNGAAAPTSGWELALVPADQPSIDNRKLAGGFDKLTLDSLYDDAMSRRSPYQTPPGSYSSGRPGTNPFEGTPAMQPGMPGHDPFAASSKFAPPPTVQMAAMNQQQQAMMMQQRMAMQQQQMYGMQSNPFGQPGFGGNAMVPYGGMGMPQQQPQVGFQSNNPFGNPNLM
eukprot:TRINITY_DN155_c0_g2_i1.p1 TRINITY_DN155_c0_g2~~TRINITY_DN155_c0_g2_i1.p1  ORF type:complete len:584 (+),score=126.50 TRINITY_DN155_c0_g2_i1:201-1952(+)